LLGARETLALLRGGDSVPPAGDGTTQAGAGQEKESGDSAAFLEARKHLRQAILQGDKAAAESVVGLAPLVLGDTKFDGISTPLQVAVYHGKTEIAILLFRRGADPDLRGWASESALETAAAEGLLSLVRLFVEELPPGQPPLDLQGALRRAAGQGKKDVVVYLLDRGADPNDAAEGIHPLSAAEGRGEVTELLRSRGADPNRPDRKGRLALVEAARLGNEVRARILVGLGADPDLRDAGGVSAREVAATLQRRDLIEILSR